MGGIHATMCTEEALARVDAVVTGEAEADLGPGSGRCPPRRAEAPLRGRACGHDEIPPARHDLLTGDYACGAIQTSRGCPLSCSFCSVTAFNGHRYRQRPIADVVREFGAIREKHVLIVDDNLIGTRPEHIARAKEFFRALIRAKTAQAVDRPGDDQHGR